MVNRLKSHLNGLCFISCCGVVCCGRLLFLFLLFFFNTVFLYAFLQSGVNCFCIRKTKNKNPPVARVWFILKGAFT